jgi:nucleoside-diphosphate-sugar epimerase|tara:strand:+ start:94 stop:993 length:900 start_codon:yes stop_codon:yes gene_type:complete
MNKILITGGSGFLGSNFIKQIPNKNKIYIYDTSKPRFKSNYIIGSILDSNKLKKVIKKYNIDTVVHLAASLGVSNTEKNPDKVLEVNFAGTQKILESLKNSNIKKFIFASSSEVYGDSQKKMSEQDILKPKSIYGHTKILGENLVKTYAKYIGFDYLIFRFFNVCGRGQREDFVIPKFFKDLKTKNEINIYGSGNQRRSFCHVNDACEAMLMTINAGFKNETFNIGNDKEPISIKNLAELIRKTSKSECKIKFQSFKNTDRTKEREIYFRKPDLKKIYKKTKYNPRISLKKIIEEYTDL